MRPPCFTREGRGTRCVAVQVPEIQYIDKFIEVPVQLLDSMPGPARTIEVFHLESLVQPAHLSNSMQTYFPTHTTCNPQNRFSGSMGSFKVTLVLQECYQQCPRSLGFDGFKRCIPTCMVQQVRRRQRHSDIHGDLKGFR